MLQIHNSLTRKKEEFIPIAQNKVGIYVCGVTVYDDCHIGHARTFVNFDMIVRYLRYKGYDVHYVRNITDIDDKIIKRAQEKNITVKELADTYIKKMHEDFAKLNILPPDDEPKATDNIPQILSLIKKLIDKKHAYIADNGDVMFDINSFKSYGALSGQNLEELNAGARVEVEKSKRNPFDFVLWKMAKSNEPFYPSEYGNGRPGWHIECSAMNSKYLGEHFDIHGGGSDLLFPHHENEIAQSCCAFGSKYVNYWMHSGMVMINHEKMSKSLNNFFTIEDVLEHYDSEVIRFFLLSAQYRSPLNYSQDNLQKAKNALSRLYTALNDVTLAPSVEDCDFAIDIKEQFNKYMDDDFNTPGAISLLFEIAKNVNKEQGVLKGQYARLLKDLADVLGILYQDPKAFLKGDNNEDDTKLIEQLILQRNNARAQKDFKQADMARDQLLSMGIILEDGPQGTTWRKK